MVAERLASSPPTRANRVQYPGRSFPDLGKCESYRWSASFLWNLQFPKPVYSGVTAFSSLFISSIPQKAMVNHRRRYRCSVGFSGISRFPRPCIPALLHAHLVSPSLALRTLMLRATEISPLHSTTGNYIDISLDKQRYGRSVRRSQAPGRNRYDVDPLACRINCNVCGRKLKLWPRRVYNPELGSAASCLRARGQQLAIILRLRDIAAGAERRTSSTARRISTTHARHAAAKSHVHASRRAKKKKNAETWHFRNRDVVRVAAYDVISSTNHASCHGGFEFQLRFDISHRVACSPPSKAIRVPIPGRVTPDFRRRESCRTVTLAGGFSRGSPVSCAFSFQTCSMLTSITLNGSLEPDCALARAVRRTGVKRGAQFYDVRRDVVP
ncbi:hypothetical protein PR048_012107 [Dryococelus australis]|uniref:Uncharacterized protein n=1 Tax=Dryococelus australis TaxID=614101 RepID=A0ABQ9HNE7_9NEOP|nr:hypothetical protein PR048_012107 [Dryococelus australis]